MAKITPHPPAAAAISAPAPLTAQHDLSKFNSGKASLDDWLRNRAFDSEGRTARTYVVCEKNAVVIGYYCVSTGSVECKSLPGKMKRERGLLKQVPLAIIGRLARDLSYRGQGLGADLLQDALTRILSASRIVGIRAVLVHALDEEATSFWKDNEFIESPVGSNTFYMPIETIAGAL